MSILTANPPSTAETNDAWTEERASEWFERREWLNGSLLQPHSSINKTEFARQYHLHRDRWNQAFVYLNDTDLLDLAPGKYPIDGENVFAIVAEADKKEFEATRWESHRQYQDIQMVIAGKEQMGIAPISSLTVTEPYADTKDITFYSGDGKFYTAEPATFFIFFPQDGHRPDIKAQGFERDKKIVVKIKVD